ncbi:hypothetical protein [Zoogloea sp.]|uniref:hypothetical protein n=1 Tax=Zoogloea sp. TaxID=49181 RepID=UPI0025F1A374|nr:hypothetical protein [Zoogloea sp.]MCK6392520.1 hypothetical protein [Zoogloea sp.]
MGDPVSEAAITGAALVRHLDDVRFATLRALRQLLRALDAERIAIGQLSPDGEHIHEELVWVSGFGRCGESERVVPCASFSDELRIWLASREDAVSIGIDARSPAWHDLPCDQLLLVRSRVAERGQPSQVLVAQLRGGVRLPESASHAISILVKEYAARRASAPEK